MKFGLTIALFLVVGIAQAIPLLPGTTVPALGAAVPTTDTLVADIMNGMWATPPSSPTASDNGSGTYSTAVYRETGGTLDFVYQFTDAASSNNSISETTSQSFAGFTTDVSIVLNPADLPPGTLFTPGTVIPTQGIFRSAPTPNNGATVGWNFDGAGNDVGPGLTSVTLIVKTDATNFSVGSIGITAGNTVNVAGYAPITGSTVPEPAMFLPAGAALLGLLAFRRRAQSKA